MTSMMGGGGAPQEDLFAKLESMRAVINEVNQQFTDPVRPFSSPSFGPLHKHHHMHGNRRRRLRA
jgi:hypothetical protein